MSRHRAGGTRAAELVVLAMAGALFFFVARQAVRTTRGLPPGPPAPAAERGAPVAAVPQAPDPAAESPAPAVSSSHAVVTGVPVTPDPAEVRRRIALAAEGTYIADMLLDTDSLLTRWPERVLEPVRVWVQRSSEIRDWKPEFARAANEAFYEWGAVGFPVRFSFTVDSAGADIHLSFADRFTEKNRLGLTTQRHDQKGWIAGATILIAVHDSAGTPLDPPVVSATARHEVGHALGLGHSRDRATIMYPEAHTLAITGPDRATLRLLYMLPPGSLK